MVEGGGEARLSRAEIALQRATVPCGQYRSLDKGHDYTSELS